jgi:hypothetical protein
MNQHFDVASVSMRSLEQKSWKPGALKFAFGVALIALAIAALAADASLTSEQHMAVFQQSNVYP